MKDKEKLVRDLVNTFEDRDVLHNAYIIKMKEIIDCAFREFSLDENYVQKIMSCTCIKEANALLGEWIDQFVEERFKPED
jgi:hypothetical protein